MFTKVAITSLFLFATLVYGIPIASDTDTKVINNINRNNTLSLDVIIDKIIIGRAEDDYSDNTNWVPVWNATDTTDDVVANVSLV